ncbi:multisubunit sodium/proton antiporter, MrpG subunit [Marinobacter daqiaonensis]|uniref:Multisubunit sodium/proton antiporter, MrpG subunit n=1 Tax=Marinobacter daqiaonensis TaxID=650891 RepID=A0A1I6HKT2_9GAMM|nr:monovalent cation/H(+) antiporter subunit G [Marinobacter daqiaonensis]SFR55069.1 multisubunit sodium/proton antiporter, MrpG subunit [Marinobacter daqiaonensis]
MTDGIVAIFLLAGATFVLLAAVGIVRLPDLATRMHASTKAGALGAMMIMAGVATHFFEQPEVITRAIAIVVFILLTAPIAAHVIGRAGYFLGIPLWDGTIKDELRDSYDQKTHVLKSGFEDNSPGKPPSERGDTHKDRTEN